MDAAAASPLLTEPLSPELVLVSPPEVARRARLLLSPHPVAGPATIRIGAVEMAAVWIFCLVMTLGPVLVLLGAGG